MRFSAVLVSLSALVASVCAQTDHKVMVGNNGSLAFSPTEVTAAAGDTVTFIFMAKNHTVTQSTFAAPCVAMAGGVDSGFQPVAAGATQVPAMTVPINATTPLWFFCAQLNPAAHCAAAGMVFAVNPTADKSFAAFQAAATSSAAPAASGTSAAAGSAATAPSGSTAAGAAASAASSAAASPSAALNPSSSTTPAAGGALSTSASAGSLLAVLGVAAGLLL